jgi:hypothetical protein
LIGNNIKIDRNKVSQTLTMASIDGIPQKPNAVERHSMSSMQELDPSPVQDELHDLESGEYVFKAQAPKHGSKSQGGLSTPKLGLSGYKWASWCRYR